LQSQLNHISLAVQCLSAVQPLTDFFIADLHLVSLNKTNPMGSEGNVTVKFENLVKNLWNGKDDKVYPLEFLKILASDALDVS
jgi:ubiquitin C-terminal hydrolase